MWREEGSGSQGATTIPLKANKALLKQYYAGARLDSPMGGFLEPLGSQPLEDGSARLLFECSTSSLRFELLLPKGSRKDRELVKEQVEGKVEPTCPRCTDRRPLHRIGNQLHCPCGVSFGRVP